MVRIVVHLDLKGGIPSMEYLGMMRDFLVSKGVRTLLLEVEDAFPYESVDLKNSHERSYPRNKLGHILKSLEGLEVIPLVQSVGHLEFLLSEPAYSAFRENPLFPDTIDPGCLAGRECILKMVEEVSETFSSTVLKREESFFHIGGDEPWQLGKVGSKTPESEVHQRYLEHIRALAMELRRHHSSRRILLWDDFIRPISLKMLEVYLKDTNGTPIVEPVVWNYSPEVLFPDIGIFDKYKQCFGSRIWCASAFKGATSSRACLPSINIHVENTKSWLQLISKQGIPVEGIILTGWQRFDHFASLCELLPVSIPSLHACLNVLIGVDESNIFGTDDPLFCLISEFTLELRPSYESMVEGDFVGTWLSDYQIRSGRVSRLQISFFVPRLRALANEFCRFREEFSSLCPKYFFFPDRVAEEWLGTFVEPLENVIHRLLQSAEKYT